MAARAYWKGYLKLSLVSCPIVLSPATSGSKKVSFHRINKDTGNRLRQQLIDEETGQPVEQDKVGRGYEVGRHRYVEVEDEELDKIKIESTHTIDIDQFVPRSEIDDRYLNMPYYIVPNGKAGLDAFAVIRDKDMVAIGRVVLTNREHPVMIEPWDKGLLATTLHYRYEVRDDKPYFEDIPDLKLPDEMKAACRAYRGHEGRAFRPRQVRGSLRGRACIAAP